MPELAMTTPLARLVPAIFFEDFDELLDLHSDSDLRIACRIAFGLTGAATELARLCRRGGYRGPVEPFVRLHGTRLFRLIPDLQFVEHARARSCLASATSFRANGQELWIDEAPFPG